MPEHHTKRTTECEAWCPQCGKKTIHRVDAGRQGPCIDEHHGDKSLTRDGAACERPFRVCYLNLAARASNTIDFRTFDEALSFFNSRPTGTASLWRTDTTPRHTQLRP